jgi:GTP cyclohydrolase I
MPLLTECMKILFPELIEQSKKLAKKIPKNKYNYVFGIPAGGLVTSYIVANEIKATMLTVDQFKNEFFNNPKVLIVDDLIDGGGTIQKFNPHKEHDVAVVYRKKHSPKNLTKYVVKEMPNEWLDFPHEKEATGIEEHIQRIMEYIGEDVKREGLVGTPSRVAKMYKEIFRGYDLSQKPVVTTFKNGHDGVTYNEMIIDEGSFFSHCEHHMVPFFGKYFFAYIPDKTILGLSKVARIIDFHSAKLQIQERLVKEIVDDLEKACKPKGIALVMKAQHLCKTMRGVKKEGYMITSDIRGVFQKNLDTRNEFLTLINKAL